MLVVLKLGSAVIESDESMRWIVDDVNRLMDEQIHVIIVSSGAIASARNLLTQVNEVSSNENKQVLAAVGQPILMRRFMECFSRYRSSKRTYLPAQALLTSEDFTDQRRQVTKGVLERLISLRVVPIVNENDVVTVEGVKDLESWEFDENDRLARMVACLLGANVVIFGTDEPGVMDNLNFNAPKLIPVLYEQDEVVISQRKIDSRGGLEAKLRESFFLVRFGKRTFVADPRGGNLYNLVQGHGVGTEIRRS